MRCSQDLQILDDPEAVARQGAKFIMDCIKTCDRPVLGLAAGRTPLAGVALRRRAELQSR